MAQLVKRKVRLYGDLAERFGSEFELKAPTLAHAIRILEANFPGEFLNAIGAKTEYYVVEGDDLDQCTGVHPDHFLDWQSDKTLHIVPAALGNSGVGKAILTVIGVVLIAAAIVMSGGTLAAPIASFMALQGVAASVAWLGVGLVISGIGMMLTPMPKTSTDDRAEDAPGFLFKGAINLSEQGSMINLCYGEHLVGSLVASASIRAVRTGREFSGDNGWGAYAPITGTGGGSSYDNPHYVDWSNIQKFYETDPYIYANEFSY